LADAAWLAARTDGVELRIHARPGAKRSAITGLHGGALCIRLGARPTDGAANRELVEVLATALGVPRDAVTLRTGARGREKRVHVRGIGADAAAERLEPYVSIDKGGARD
jgi:uncharacterized protein (TIGR00251 family)